MLVMRGVKAHYDRVERETWRKSPIRTKDLRSHIVVIPVGRWNAVAEEALRFAWTLSQDIRIVHEALLLYGGEQRITIIDVPWYLG
jgi:hypothetical protein